MAATMAPTVSNSPTAFRARFQRALTLAARLLSWVAVLNILWSIAITSGLLSGLSQRLLQTSRTGFNAVYWLLQQHIAATAGVPFNAAFLLLQQIVLRVLVVLTLVSLGITVATNREDRTGKVARTMVNTFGLIVIWLIAERVFVVTQATHYPITLWVLQVVNGLVLGSLYALIALGYTLVYGILRMINFAHGDVMMVGSYLAYFALQFFRGDPYIFVPHSLPPESASIINTFLMMLFIVVVAMVGSMLTGLAIERIAYRPLRRAPRLAPLISAIGMSIFLEQAAQRIFGPIPRSFDRPTLLNGTFIINVGREFGPPIPIAKTGILVFVAAIVLMIGLYVLVRRTKLGRAMRAVAEDKDTAALMGADVDRVIAFTFALGAALAGAAGFMWGFHTGQTDPFAGFLPGIKAFTSAVLGGIGNIPGAVFGGIFLGLVEALGPSALGIPNEYQNVIAFALLVFILIFRPTGILGEILAEKKV